MAEENPEQAASTYVGGSEARLRTASDKLQFPERYALAQSPNLGQRVSVCHTQLLQVKSDKTRKISRSAPSPRPPGGRRPASSL